jgi:hypothetical protein
LGEGKMDSLLTLNVVGYAAALGGGVVVGTLFGRSIVSDLGGIVHSLEARVITLETALHLSGAAVKPAADPTAAAAIKSHAEATEKLAAAIQTHAAAQTAATEKSAAVKPASN